MRELSAGIYNLLKSTKSKAMSVSTLLNRVKTSVDTLEAKFMHNASESVRKQTILVYKIKLTAVHDS